jgi:hypothetical protein
MSVGGTTSSRITTITSNKQQAHTQKTLNFLNEMFSTRFYVLLTFLYLMKAECTRIA